MLKTLKTAALSALIGLGGLAALPASASADTLTLRFSTGPTSINHGGRHVRPLPPRYRECTPARALNKAVRMGLRNARVRNANRTIINVRGRDRGGPILVTFARAPGCPVIRTR